MHAIRFLVFAAAVILSGLAPPPALAQTSSTFTYQGKLTGNGSPLNGTADFRFQIYGANGFQLADDQEVLGATVTNGVFEANLDFGHTVFDGSPRFLQIFVRFPAGSGNFTLLLPRTRIKVVPMALSAAGWNTAIITGVDQQQQSSNGVTSTTVASQTLRASYSGSLRTVEIGVRNLAAPRTVVLSALVNGGQVGSRTVLVPNNFAGNISLNMNTVEVLSTDTITIRVDGGATPIDIPFQSGNPYPNGASSTGANDDLVFRTIMGERGSSAIGNVGIGTTAPAVKLHVVGDTRMSGKLELGAGAPELPAGIARLHITGNAGLLNLEGSDHAYIQFYPDGFAAGRRAYIGFPGAASNDLNVQNESPGAFLNLVATTVRVQGIFINSSDGRDKCDVAPIEAPLDLVLQLRGVRHRWLEAAKDADQEGSAERKVDDSRSETMGFIAQEVEGVLPQLVATDEAGKKGVNYVAVVPLLVEAMKAQQARIAELEERLKKLEEAASRKR